MQKRGFGVSQNTDAKKVIVTKISGEASVDVVPTITLGVSPNPLKWGVQATASGQVTGFISSDSVTIIWGDGTSTSGILISPTGGWSATHTYLSSAVGTNVVKAQLKNGASLIVESTTVSVTVEKHDTAFTAANNIGDIIWGGSITKDVTLTDTSLSVPVVGATITLGGTGLGTLSPSATTNGAGSISVSGNAPGGPAGPVAVSVSYAGDGSYNLASTPDDTYNTLKHAVSLTLGVNGPLSEATTAVAGGAVTDNDLPSNPVNGVTVQITDNGGINFPDPQTAGISVTDGGSGLSVSGGVLTVNPNTVFVIPFSPTEVSFSFSGIVTAGNIVLDVTYNNPAIPPVPPTLTSTLTTAVPAGNPNRAVSFGSGIVSVKFVSFPDVTLGFSNVQTRNLGNLVQ
ncbi:MAG: hypothetical protein ACRD32_07300, partial [Nitrososphaerales archaeon]